MAGLGEKSSLRVALFSDLTRWRKWSAVTTVTPIDCVLLESSLGVWSRKNTFTPPTQSGEGTVESGEREGGM